MKETQLSFSFLQLHHSVLNFYQIIYSWVRFQEALRRGLAFPHWPVSTHSLQREDNCTTLARRHRPKQLLQIIQV